MKLFVINLQRATDRREFMRQQLDALPLQYEFFAGTDAARGELAGISRYDEAAAIRSSGQTLLPGECGCFASHYRLWQRCVELDEPIVIMEDDVIVAAGFSRVLGVLDEPLRHLRFVRLAGLWACPYDEIAGLDVDYRLVRYRRGPVGTQCYALTPDGAAVLLRHAQVWIDAVDRYIDRFWTHGLDSYAILPFTVRLPAVELSSNIVGQRVVSHSRTRHQLMRLGQRIARIWYNLRYRFSRQRPYPHHERAF